MAGNSRSTTNADAPLRLRILGEVVTVVREAPDAEERVARAHVVRTVGDPR